MKYNFLNKSKNLTPADIKAQMNFNNVVKGASIWAGFKLGSTLLKLGTKMTTAAVAGTSTVVVTAAVVVAVNTDLLKSDEAVAEMNAPTQEVVIPVVSDSTSQVVIKSSSSLDSLVEAVEEIVPQEVIDAAATNTTPPLVIPEQVGVADSIMEVDVKTKARPLPDMRTFHAFINKELKYPTNQINVDVNDQNELSKPKEGYVHVHWTINKEGIAEHFKILKSMGESFDNEAIRVIKAYPNWKPASYNGEAVESNLEMKIHFNVR